MWKNIIACMVLVITVLAFPARLFVDSSSTVYLLSILKGMLFIFLLLLLAGRSRLRINLFHIKFSSVNKITLPAIILLVIYLVINYKKIFLTEIPHPWILSFVLPAVFVLAMAEEIAFRWYIQKNLLQQRPGKLRSVLISSTLFAMAHCINFFRLDNDIFSLINQLLFAFFMGMLLASLYFITRSLLLVTLYHFIVNLPAAISKIKVTGLSANETTGHESIADNLIGLALYILLLSPLIIISFFYLGKIKENEHANRKTPVNNHAGFNL